MCNGRFGCDVQFRLPAAMVPPLHLGKTDFRLRFISEKMRIWAPTAKNYLKQIPNMEPKRSEVEPKGSKRGPQAAKVEPEGRQTESKGDKRDSTIRNKSTTIRSRVSTPKRIEKGISGINFGIIVGNISLSRTRSKIGAQVGVGKTWNLLPKEYRPEAKTNVANHQNQCLTWSWKRCRNLWYIFLKCKHIKFDRTVHQISRFCMMDVQTGKQSKNHQKWNKHP